MCMEPLTLHFGDGRYMVGGYLLEESTNAGICVYLNPNKSPALGQTDPDAIGKTTEEVGSILNLEFSNTQSIDVWINELHQVKKDLANQIIGSEDGHENKSLGSQSLNSHLIEALNSLPVEEYSCSGNECEYVLTELSAKNIEVLLNAGFPAALIDDAMGDYQDCIELSILGFQYAGASWWSSKTGFSEQREDERGNK